jgi:hypothetical protein
MTRISHFLLLVGLFAWPCLCAAQRPDASTGADAVEHTAEKLTLSDGARLEKQNDPRGHAFAVVLPKVTYGESG